MRKLVFALLLLSSIGSAQKGLITSKAMVVSARQEASNIGVDIIKQGGNCFDAMIATELALAVAYPYAGNISGGGFMVYRLADGTTGTLDYREKAPMAASRDMYLDPQGKVIAGSSTQTGLAVGVPGTVAGIFEVYKKFGSLPLEKLFRPAIVLAKKGVAVTQKQLTQIENNKALIVQLNGDKSLYNSFFSIGDTIKYPALAQTLEMLLKNGRDEFYKGATAKKIVKFVQQKGGVITLKDLSNYEALWRDPIAFHYKNLKVISMALPSSGGFCLAQIMKMIEPFDLYKLKHNSDKYIQLLAEAQRRSFADRNYFLGDPAFTKIPVSQLLDKAYLYHRIEDFSFEHATPSSQVAHGTVNFAESNETTHYSIVDSKGNAVAVTTTLNGAYGSKLYCDELGFFLNNQMDDFSAKPGEANSYGLTGSEANSIAPGKRMLSSMTPTIVEKNGKLFMVLGSPGGSTIITSVLQTILNVSEFRMGMQQAVDAARFHHQWLPDVIMIEPGRFEPKIKSSLAAKGYQIDEKYAPVLGKVDAILALPDGKFEAGADKRGDDAAAGF